MNDTDLLGKVKYQLDTYGKLSNQLIMEVRDHKFDDFSASNGKRVVELEKQNAALKQDLGLMKISFEQKRDLLKSCEIALEERDDQAAELVKERNELNKLNSKIVRIADAIKTCFPCLTVCDGVLFVKIDGYNKLVEVMNDEY